MDKAKALTAKQQHYRKRLLAAIHQSTSYVSYYIKHRDVYEQMLNNAFGKRSAADLSITQLNKLLDILNRKTGGSYPYSHKKQIAAKPTNKKAPKNTVTAINTGKKTADVTVAAPVQRITPAQIVFIKNNWANKARNPTQKALNQLVFKLFKIHIIGLHALTKKQANGVISAINRIKT